jgi:predicted NAD/FAD-binding protein
VLARIVYRHPRSTAESVRAQRELPSLNGVRRTAFAGAYHGFGFHEDGLVSGLSAAAALAARR